jgi:hypothetical protein
MYDVFPDGQRFVMIHNDENALGDTVRIVENWAAPYRSRR